MKSLSFSNPPAPGLIKRWGRITLLFFLSAAILFGLARFYSGKLGRTTGGASWLWSDHRIAEDTPESFFLVRDFDFPPNSTFLHLRVVADPGYTLWFNGAEIGGSHSEGRTIETYDVTVQARPEGNRVVIGVRSARGVGGVLASVDLAPMKRNWLVTDESWRLYDRWIPGLLQSGFEAPGASTPRVLGRPPFGRWNYPEPKSGEPFGERRSVIPAREVIRFDASLPRLEKKSGIMVAGSVPASAAAFDFGHVLGRAALRVSPGPTRVVSVRYAGHPDDLNLEALPEAFVVGESEREVVSPERRAFRYLIVYDEDAEAVVFKDEPDGSP
ncbi:MAG TPA: hypothetical protein VM557_02125 [Thermoanaerobaculia bacterium]|nr:hypothetical protein [Thermoanaerobaculia bacterium]